MSYSSLALDPVQVSSSLAKKEYYTFVQEFWNVIEDGEFIPNWHIKYMCDEIQKVVDRVVNREPKLYDLCINISPGSTKSTVVSKMLLPYMWSRNRSVKYIAASYSGDLSEDFLIKAKKIINSNKYKNYFGEIEFDKKMNRNKRFRNIQNGEAMATSVGGQTLGSHGDIITLDDLIDVEDAYSRAAREKAKKYLTETISGRKTSRLGTPIIMVGQRLHVGDPTDVMLDEFPNVKHIKIPAEISDFTPKPESLKEKYEDQLMNKKRMDWNFLKPIKEKSPVLYSTQYGQQPGSNSGNIWKDNFNWVQPDELPSIYKLADYGTDWDTAYTKKTQQSASAYVTSGRLGENIFMYDLGWFWKETPEVKQYIREMENAGTHFFENKANGRAMHDDLKHENIPVRLVTDVPNKGDSIARANMASDKAATGKIYVNIALKEKMLRDRKQGLLKFPAGHDDLSDAISQAILRHSKMRSALW